MRLYRWKALSDGRWVYWYYRYYKDRDSHKIDRGDQLESWCDVDGDTVWQCIWRKDKNWVDIYDGDIVAFLCTRYIDRWDSADWLYDAIEWVNTIKINNHPDIRQYMFLSDEDKKKYIEYKEEKIVSWYEIVSESDNVVRWENNSFEPFCDSRKNCWCYWWWGDSQKCIVVWNIHENPELIEKV